MQRSALVEWASHLCMGLVVPIDAGTFVVPSEKEDILGVFQLVSQYQRDCLQ